MRLSRSMMRLLLSAEEHRAATSELDELYELRRARDGERAASAWRRRQEAQFLWRLLADRPRRSWTERLGDVGRDLRHSLRSLARTPALTATVVLTVGLGIGATTAILAVVHGVLMRPLPYADPERLVRIYTDSPPFRWAFSVVDYRALEEQQTSFAQVAGYTNRTMTVNAGDAAERVSGKIVTWTYFSVLGLSPLHGRLFDREDGVPGRPPSVVVSHGLWTRRLGADPAAVGRPIRLDGALYTLVGVLPPEAGTLDQRKEFFAAAQWEEPKRKGPFFIVAIGRLRPGVTRAAAVGELRAINRRLFPLWKASYQDERATWGAMDLKDYVVGNVGPILLVVLVAVAFVLLIACTNAANLLVARADHRRRELAVRSALGASRGRLLQHLLSESAVLAAGAALLGIALAKLGIRLAGTLGADYLPRTREIGLDGPALACLIVLTVGSGALFGLVPALHALSVRVERGLASGGRSTTDAAGPRRLRRALVVAEFAVATPLLIAAGLLIASLLRLQRVDPGFDARGVLTAGVFVPEAVYPDDAAVAGFWQRAKLRLDTLPGVRSAAFADTRAPREDAVDMNNFDLEDHPAAPGHPQPVVPFVRVSPEYFRVLGLRLAGGRLLEETDALPTAPPVVVVDEAWADRFFPGQDSVGRRFREGGCTTCPWTTVVGVVGAVKYLGLDHPDEGAVYQPMPPGQRARYFVLRTAGDPAGVVPSLRQAVREIDPTLPLTGIATVEELMADSLEVPRYLSVLVGAFASVALLLSVVGIYGVMSYFVQQQSRDIGIRMALGAEPASVLRMVVGHGMRVVGLGVVAGVAGALALTRLLTTLLYDVKATDAGTFLAVSSLMLVAALVACLLPALRAAGVDPARTLRQE